MIATHNIKVNGRWYVAGEEVPDQQQVIEEAVIPEAEEPVEKKPVKEEQKPKSTATRRRTTK